MTEFQQELLSAYLDGECDPEERLQVEALLKNSPEAQEFFQELGGDHRSLRQSLSPSPLSDAALRHSRDRILESLPAPASEVPWFERLQDWLTSRSLVLATASCLALILLVPSRTQVLPDRIPSQSSHPTLTSFGPRARDVLTATSSDPEALVTTLYLEEAGIDVVWVLQ